MMLELGDPVTLLAIRNTVWVSGLASLIALLITAPLSFVLYRTDLPLRGVFSRMLTLPAAVPPYIWAMGWIALANPKSGLVNLFLGRPLLNVYSATGIAFVLGTTGVPFVLLASSAAFARIDSSLEEAARMCGASAPRAFFAATLPLVWPSLLSGALLVFLTSVASFGVPYLLGASANPPLGFLTTRIYAHLLMSSAEGMNRATYGAITLLLIAAVAMLASTMLSRSGRVKLTLGKGGAVRLLGLRHWRVPFLAIVALATTAIIVAPLIGLILTSLQGTPDKGFGAENLSLDHWHAVLSHPRVLHAAIKSLVLSVGAGLLVAAVGVGLASLRLARLWGYALVEGLANLPFAIPGTVFAMSLLFLFSKDIRFVFLDRFALVLSIANSAWLLILGYVLKHLAYGVRNASESFAQLDLSLSEAARMSGASSKRAFFTITLPLIRTAILSAFLLTFLVCLSELTMSVLLVPPGTDLLGTLIFEWQSYADPQSAAVLSCALVVLVILAMWVLEALRERTLVRR